MNTIGVEQMKEVSLKKPGITHWRSPNTGATNESGFTALPGGGRSHVSTSLPCFPWGKVDPLMF